MTTTVLDTFFSHVQLDLLVSPVQVQENELVHVMGTSEPVRDHPDERTRSLLGAGLLVVESVKATLPEEKRLELVTDIQNKARAWLKAPPPEADAEMMQQVRWLFSKARAKESPQQIIQRVWLTAVLYNLGMRHLRYTDKGGIRWDGGSTERIGMGPDAHLDAAIESGQHTLYVASYRRPDGTVVRGKGRQRWYIYRLRLDPSVDVLFERRKTIVQENVALIVASETRATQPQLPRDFYGGDEFQQACIDAQDPQFQHALVLSPAHGVISLDETVPSDIDWDEIVSGQFLRWQTKVIYKLGAYLFGEARHRVKVPENFNWWLWLNPESIYSFTVFGGGLAVRMLFDYLLSARPYALDQWPHLILAERRLGYGADDFEEDLNFGLGALLGEEEYLSENELLDTVLPELDQLMHWASLFADRVSLYVAPIDQSWELHADEALLPVRLLHDAGVPMDTLLTTLTEIAFLVEQNAPFNVLIDTHSLVATLLQFTHNLVHRDHHVANEVLKIVVDPALRHYLETALREPDIEDRLCAALALTEQVQMLALLIPQHAQEKLAVWLHTYIAGRVSH